MQELEDFPFTANSPQIENIALPPTYQEAVLEKKRARENAEQWNGVLPQTMLAEDGAVLFSLREGPDRNGQGAAPCPTPHPGRAPPRPQRSRFRSRSGPVSRSSSAARSAHSRSRRAVRYACTPSV